MGSDIARLQDEPALDEAQARTVATYARTLVDVVRSRKGTGSGGKSYEELLEEARKIPALREALAASGHE